MAPNFLQSLKRLMSIPAELVLKFWASLSAQKNAFLVTLIASLLLASAAKPAHALPGAAGMGMGRAAGSKISSLISSLVTVPLDFIGTIITFIAYIFGLIGSIFVIIEAWFISFLLNLSSGIAQSAAVQGGFNITLSLANLGFVLGIIVIAIATILRQETYGIKQLLWKLVFAAVLVNFSLVIGSTVLNFADSLSAWFLNCITDKCSTGAVSITTFHNFANRLADAFDPQKLYITKEVPGTAGLKAGSFAELGGAIGKGAGGVLAIFAPILFTLALVLIIVITLAGLAVMLLIRYVVLTLLFVLMPLAWLAWIFPGFSGQFKKWWDSFFRWAFFAPLVLLFVYIALGTATEMKKGDPFAVPQFASGSNPAFAAISAFAAGLVGTILQPMLQIVLIAGLMIGGLIAANQLSIMGAKATYGAITGGLKAGGAWFAKTGGRNALRLAARAVQPKQPPPPTAPQLHPIPNLPQSPPGAPPTPPPPTTTMPLGGPQVTIVPTAGPTPQPGGPAQPPPGGAVPPVAPQPTAAGPQRPQAPQSWLTQQRQKLAGQLTKLSTHPAVQSGGFFGSVWDGTKKGSGLFKGKVKSWTCQNCKSPIYSMAKPDNDFQCPTCTESTNSLRSAKNDPQYQNWQ